MKKFYSRKPAIIASLVAVVLIAVSCGLTITELTFSSHTPMQGEELTITTKFERASTDPKQYANYNNLYLYYGVRVPEDWSTAEMITAVDTETGNEPVKFKFEDSEFYAKLLELSYPKEGYKWIGYQSVERYSVLGQPTVSSVTLKVGSKLGSYVVDIAAGSSASAPADMLNEDGSIKYDVAFNNNNDNNMIDGVKYITFQEYLLNAATISKEEVDSRKLSLADIKVINKDVEYSISPMDIANYPGMYIKPDDAGKITPMPDFNRTVEVTVNTGIDDVTSDVAEVNVVAVDGGVEVEAQGAVATVYSVTGTVVDSRAVNGIARLNAQRGLNIVKVQTLAGTSTSKVIVK